MALKYLLIGAIILSVFAAGTLGVSIASAKTLKLTSIFVNNQTGGNVTTFNGTTQTFEGTDEELASIYFNALEGYERKLNFVEPGEPVTFVFRNNTNVTVPYSGTYRISESEALLNEVLNGTKPLSNASKILNIPPPFANVSYVNEVCWVSGPYWEHHWFCSEDPFQE